MNFIHIRTYTYVTIIINTYIVIDIIICTYTSLSLSLSPSLKDGRSCTYMYVYIYVYTGHMSCIWVGQHACFRSETQTWRLMLVVCVGFPSRQASVQTKSMWTLSRMHHAQPVSTGKLHLASGLIGALELHSWARPAWIWKGRWATRESRTDRNKTRPTQFNQRLGTPRKSKGAWRWEEVAQKGTSPVPPNPTNA